MVCCCLDVSLQQFKMCFQHLAFGSCPIRGFICMLDSWHDWCIIGCIWNFLLFDSSIIFWIFNITMLVRRGQMKFSDSIFANSLRGSPLKPRALKHVWGKSSRGRRRGRHHIERIVGCYEQCSAEKNWLALSS